MTLDEFENSLDRWGSNLAAWPEPARSEGTSLLRESEAARRELAHAQNIDDLLAATHRAPASVRQEIVDRVAANDVWQRLAEWFANTLWKPALAAACTLALGFAIGFSSSAVDVTDNDLAEASTLTFFDGYQEIDDAL